jgi:multimeric flavodoxin WrbA
MPLDNIQHKTDAMITPGETVLGIGASPRKNGNSDVLLKYVLKGVRKQGVSVEKVHLRDYQYQPCIGCEKCRKDKICSGLKDGMHLIYPHVLGSRGLALVCPTHNYNITAWMKAFIDRLYCFFEFNTHRPRGWSSHFEGQKRKAVLIAVCEQVDKKDMGFTLEAMRLPVKALGYDIVGELPVFGMFDRGIVKEYENVLFEAHQLGKKLADAILR